jgi:hypothetical protein
MIYCINFVCILLMMNLLTINKGSVDSSIKFAYEENSLIPISMSLFWSRSSNVSIAFDLQVLDIFTM